MEEVAGFTAAFRLDDLIILRADQSSQLGYMVSRGILYAASDWFRKMLSQGHGNSSAASDPFASLFASDTASKAAPVAAPGSSNGESFNELLDAYLQTNPFGGFGRSKSPNVASTQPPPSLFNFTDPTDSLPKPSSTDWTQPPAKTFNFTGSTTSLPKASSAASTKAPAKTFKFTGSTGSLPKPSRTSNDFPASLFSSKELATDDPFGFNHFTVSRTLTLPNCDHETLQLLIFYLLNGHKVPRFRTEYTRVASECDSYKIRTSLHASSVRSQFLLAKLWCLGETVQMPRLQNITLLSLQDLLQVSGVTVEAVEAAFEMTGEESKLREVLAREFVWNWKAQAYGQGEMDRLGKVSGFMVLFAKMLAECPTRECAHKPHCAPSVGGVVPFFVAAAGEKRSRDQMEAGGL